MDRARGPITRGTKRPRANTAAHANNSCGGTPNVPSSTAAAIQQALQCNRRAQLELATHLQRIASQMADNRRQASRLTRHLYHTMEHHVEQEVVVTPQATTPCNDKKHHESVEQEVAAIRRVIQSVAGGVQEQRPLETTTTAAAEEAAANASNNNSKKDNPSHDHAEQPTTQQQQQQQQQEAVALSEDDFKLLQTWRLNQQLPAAVHPHPNDWKRRFFTDPLDSVPQANADIVARRQVESDPQAWFQHQCPPWSKSETKLLMQIVEQQQHQQQSPSKTSKNNKKNNQQAADAMAIDYEVVAEQMEKAQTPADSTDMSTAPSQKKNAFPLRQPRTPRECQLRHERILDEQDQKKWTKAETFRLMELVRQQRQADENKDENVLNWNRISEQMSGENISDTGNKRQQPPQQQRSPWQCFANYRKLASQQQCTPQFSSVQDELLFKYMAAMGPQYLLEKPQAVEIVQGLFPGQKNSRQVYDRLHHSLLNPKLQMGAWTTYEERKLVLTQKVYRDEGKNAIMRASPHFTDRAAKSVREKWTRCLDPAFVQATWTAQEDSLLKSQVNKLLRDAEKRHQLLESSANKNQDLSGVDDGDDTGPVIPWTQLARDHFPDRRPEQLSARWTQCIATDKELVQKIRFGLAQECVNRGDVVVRGASSKEKKGNDSADEGLQEGRSPLTNQQQQRRETADEQFVLQLVMKGGKRVRKKRAGGKSPR